MSEAVEGISAETRGRLEIIVAKAEELQEWRFFKHRIERGFSQSVRLHSAASGGGITVSKRDLPDKEALTAVINNLRFFSLLNERICLFRDDWVQPKPSRPPAWLSDAGLDTNWLGWWDVTQNQLNAYLSEEMYWASLTWDFDVQRLTDGTIGTSVTNGVLYDVFAFGDTTHSTKRSAFQAWKANEFLFSQVEFALYEVLAVLIKGVARIGHLSQLVLDNQPLPPPRQTPLVTYKEAD